MGPVLFGDFAAGVISASPWKGEGRGGIHATEKMREGVTLGG